ncbi:MAG: hypothetical protein AB1896_14640 [Thermodesulfobacteriota bacterium]
MKCPKCSFTSFDYNDACPKCGKDLGPTRQLLGLTGAAPQNKLWLATLLGAAAPASLDEEMAEELPVEEADTAMLADLGEEEAGEEVSLTGAEEVQLEGAEEIEETLAVDEEEGISISPEEFGLEAKAPRGGAKPAAKDEEEDLGLELTLDEEPEELVMDTEEAAGPKSGGVESDSLGEATMPLSMDDLEEDSSDLVLEAESEGALGTEDTMELEAGGDLLAEEEEAEEEISFDPNSTMIIEPEAEAILHESEEDLTLAEDDTLSEGGEEEGLSLDLEDLELNLDEG